MAASPALSGPRPVELAAPELPLDVAPIPLDVARPALEPPPPPPLAAPAIDLGNVPMPRFLTTVVKPLPVVDDPGGFKCMFVAFRRAASVAECGVHRMLTGDGRGAREAFEESLAIEPRGAQAATANAWLGELALLEGRLEPAERYYRTALAQGPPAPLLAHAALGAGLAALRRGDAGGADRLLGEALRALPPQPVALVARYLQGIARLLSGQAPEALALWEGIERSGASDAMVLEVPFWRGVALGWVGESERAVETLDRFVRTAPTHPLRVDALVQAGWIRLERGAPDDAERRFREAAGLAPRPEVRPQLQAGLVRVYLALGDSARATAAARRLAAEAPRDPLVGPLLLTIAEAAQARGAPAESLDAYRQILLLPLAPPLQDYVTYRLGEGLERQGVLGEAKERYRALRDRGRDEATAERASYHLGLMALNEGDLGGARREGETLLKAGSVADLREGALLLAGEAAARGDDPNRAATVFRLALKEFPASPRAARIRLALGWALLKDGDAESALREWRPLLGRGSDLDTRRAAALAIAGVSLKEGREEEALGVLHQNGPLPAGHALADVAAIDLGVLALRARAYADAVQALEPVSARASDLARQAVIRRALGIAHYRLGEWDLAERQFRQATSVAPAEPSNWLGVGLAALAQNRLTEAEDALSRARMAVPEVAAAAQYGLVVTASVRQDALGFRERAATFVERFPGHPAAPALVYALVAGALDRGQLEEAQAWARQLLRADPPSDYATDALERLAAGAAKRPDILRDTYRDLLARPVPADVRQRAWLGLGEAALAAGDPAEAQRAAQGFLQAAGSDPSAARAQALLVRAYQAQGQRARALEATEAFLARFPEDPLAPTIQLTRGELLAGERRWEAAQRSFEVARDKGDAAVAAPAQFWIGESLRARGNDEGAISAYLGATYLYPETPWAARGLQGAAQSYVSRRMPREAAIVLRRLLATPGAEPALVQWARGALAQIGPVADAEAPSRARQGPPVRP